MYIIIPIGSMVLLYMLAWIPSIYPIYLSIYTVPYMDPSWDIYIYIGSIYPASARSAPHQA